MDQCFSNLPYQFCRTKYAKPNQTYLTKPTKPNLPNQTYQTKPTNPNLPNETCQFEPTKPNQTTKHTEPNLLNQNYWSKQSTPGSVVPLAMFPDRIYLTYSGERFTTRLVRHHLWVGSRGTWCPSCWGSRWTGFLHRCSTFSLISGVSRTSRAAACRVWGNENLPQENL